MHFLRVIISAISVHLVAAATKMPAIHRSWSDLTPASSHGLSKRGTCEAGNVNGYKCCSDGYYCLSSEECVGGFDSEMDWCCPIGSYYYEEECLLSDGSEQEPYPDLGYFQISGLTYYVSTATFTTTEWYGGYGDYFTPESNSLTAEVDVFETSLVCQTTDSVAASSYFTSVSSSLSYAFSSSAAYESSSLARQGYKATIITLTSSASPIASPSSSPFLTGGSASAVSASSAQPLTKTASGGISSTTGTAEHHSTTSDSTSKSVTSTAPPTSSATGNAGSLTRLAGSELIAALSLTLFGLTSGVFALLL